MAQLTVKHESTAVTVLTRRLVGVSICGRNLDNNCNYTAPKSHPKISKMPSQKRDTNQALFKLTDNVIFNALVLLIVRMVFPTLLDIRNPDGGRRFGLTYFDSLNRASEL